jgi:tetratricopeptide (TPR) repeat protein
LHRTIQRAARWSLLAFLVAGALILAAGLVRYGGPEGLWRRANAEIADYLPHPVYVPTPMAAAQPAADFEFTSSAVSSGVLPRENTAVAAAVVPAVVEPARPAVSSDTIASGPLFRANTTARTVAERSAVVAAAAQAGAALAGIDDDAESLHTQRPTRMPTPTPTMPPPTATLAPPVLPANQLTGLAHYWQTWNNCGPATLAMNLSYFGVEHGQDTVASTLRPYRDDKNVNPWEMAEYARSQGLRSIARVNGDAGRLRALVDAGVPVLIETWYEPEPNDGMGHYRLIVGYDDPAGEWVVYDSYDSHGIKKDQPYAGIRLPYDGLDRLWAVFNRAYVVTYDDARAAAVEAIIGGDLDDTAMWQRSLAAAESAAQANPQDPFAWFNLGSSLVALGDHPRAAQAFDQARNIKLPWRMLWYQFAPFRAYFEVGRYDEVIALADATLAQAKSVEELFFWRGRALQAKGDVEGARAAWQAALEFNPHYAEASAALAGLP